MLGRIRWVRVRFCNGGRRSNLFKLSARIYAALSLREEEWRCARNSVGDWPKTRLNMRLN